MKKKFFMVFGPIVVACLLCVGCFMLPPKNSPYTLEKASQSLNMNVISGEYIKNEAVAEKKYVPFFGSSELNRFDPFHPSVLAAKYHRPYTPFLLGSAGTQSLKQFMIIQSMGKDLRQKKAVFIISPQWFVPKGVKQQYFDHWYSGVQLYNWLNKIKKKDSFSKADRVFAKRLQHFTIIRDNPRIMKYLQQVCMDIPFSNAQRKAIQRNYKFLLREDRLFGEEGITAKNLHKVQQFEKQLPATYNYADLDRLAFSIGKKNTDSNRLQIANGFYNKRLRRIIKSFKGKDKNVSYVTSPEYADFELVLNQFAKEKTDVLFIIPPINPLWAKYTDLSKPMIEQFSKKIMHQLKSQGFNNVVNLLNVDTDYFMTDTIHIGWRGWLYCDRYIRPFLESTYQEPNYKINPYYYSKAWQNKKEVR